jgi:hypothetical protein
MMMLIVITSIHSRENHHSLAQQHPFERPIEECNPSPVRTRVGQIHTVPGVSVR